MYTLDQVLALMEQSGTWLWRIEELPAKGKPRVIAYNDDDPDPDASRSKLEAVVGRFGNLSLQVHARRTAKSHGDGAIGPLELIPANPAPQGRGIQGLSGYQPTSPYEVIFQQMGGLSGFIPRGQADQERALASREMNVAIKEAMLERDRREFDERKKEMLADLKAKEERAESRSEQVARGMGKVLGDAFDTWTDKPSKQIAGAEEGGGQTPAAAAIEALATHIYEALVDVEDVNAVSRVAVSFVAALPALKDKGRVPNAEESIGKLLTTLQK